MAQNPNWPTIEDAWGPIWNCQGGTSPVDRFVETTDRTRGGNSISRGRQYELDTVRAGEYSVVLANPDGSLDPTNVSGPWYGHILPYQPYRKRAQYPPTVNMLTQVQATGGDLGGYALGNIPGGFGGVGVITGVDVTGGQIVASGTAWQGARCFQFAVPNATAANSAVTATAQPAVIPGQTYSMQMWVRNITPSTSMQVQAYANTQDATGAVISLVAGSTATLTGSATAAWTQITVTFTAPATAAGLIVGVRTAALATAATALQVDGWQLEKGGTTTTWVQPGVTYPMIAGFVERWPAQWELGGTYGMVAPTAVDAFALLSQKQLSDPLTEEINSHNPRFLFKLDDPAGSPSATDTTGTYPGLLPANGKYGASSITFGTAITAANPTTGTYAGSSGTVAKFNNPSPGQNIYGPCTYLSLTGSGIIGPASPTTTWTRMVAFRYTSTTPSYAADIWMCADKQRSGGTLSGSSLVMTIDSSGYFVVNIGGPTGAGSSFSTLIAVADSNWHLAVVSYSHAAASFMISIDGVSATWTSISPTVEPTGLASDSIGAFVDNQIKFTSANFGGDMSFVAEFPTALSGTDAHNLYTAWKSSCAGESSDARYRRILGYAGYTGPTSIQAGLTASMGPCKTDGQDAVSALQGVVTTEGGQHYVAKDGRITFLARSIRYNAKVPVYTFGENLAGGEWPYEGVTTDYDPTRLANEVTVTQESTGQNFAAQDDTSITNYFPRSLTRTINSSSALECQDAANYLLSRYKAPAVRISSLKLHPSAMPALWPVCLDLEQGMRVRVVRRPQGLAAITLECFVEKVDWAMDDGGEAWCTVQCSPADTTPYAVFASWHTTLKTSVLSGVTSIVVNASQDTTNPLATQLAAGQQIVLGQNSANQETVTVSAVGATSPGWTSATITLTGATTKAHTAADVICEPLPAGTTDPTTWDAVAMFDAVAFSY